MARLFGIIGNRPDLAARILASEADALRARSKGAPLGWGLGFYQGGEVLMRRRPIDERREIDVAKLAADVRADLVVGTFVSPRSVPCERRTRIHFATGSGYLLRRVRFRTSGRCATD